MLYDAQQKAQPAIKKKVVSIGKKVLTSGKSKSKVERVASEKANDMNKFRKGYKSNARIELSDAASLIDKHFLGEF